MKKILGLDIGTTSIGWAIVEATDEKKANDKTGVIADTDINNDRIGIHKDAVGVRIISQDTTNLQSFIKGEKLVKGSTLTPTANRRVKRGIRRLKSRYKLRRGKLHQVLDFLGMLPEGITKTILDNNRIVFNQNENSRYYTAKKGSRVSDDIGKAIYELRDRATREKISLQELGRVLLHLNQWRGYSSDRFSTAEKDETSAGTTAIVVKIEQGDDFVSKKKNKGKVVETKYNTFIIHFDNGENGIVVRSKDNDNSDLINGVLWTYKFKDEDEINGYKPIEKKKTDENSWAFKKDKINTSIQEWCKAGGILGSYFYNQHYVERKQDSRIRNNVIDRDWYENEFDKIWYFQYEKHKVFFEKINIEDVVKIAFKDYQVILNEVKKKDGIREQLKCLIKDKIIYYQRPWQQAKNKGQCPFEKIKIKKEVTIKGAGKKEIVDVHVGRTVIPRSHPLFQEFKIWQQVNNVRVYLIVSDSKFDLFSDGVSFKKHIGKDISEVKQMLFNALQNCKTLSWKNFAETELDLKNKKEILIEETGEIIKCHFEFNFRKLKRDKVTWVDIKLKGNTTKASLQTILKDKTDNWFSEIHSTKQKISNLQLLWEIIYDITNRDVSKLAVIIKKHFSDFNDNTCEKLAQIKFDDSGMGNLSAKAIRHILPMMSNGDNLTEKAKIKIDSLIALNQSEEEKNIDKDEKLEGLKNFITDKKARLRLSQYSKQSDFTYLNYWEAVAVMYGSHSSKNIISKSEISRVENRSMNNPVVEKIVNETISIVNEIYKRYGFDEVRIELSRELKASMDEREQMWETINNNAAKNEWAKQMLRELKSDSVHSNSDLETSNKNNLDKIKIIEDVVKHKNADEYKQKVKDYNLGEPSKAEVKKYLMWLEQNFKCPYTNQPIPLTDVFARGKVVEIEHILPKERYYLNSYTNKVITWREVNQAKASNGNRTAYEFIVSKRVEETIKVGNKSLPLVAKEKWEEHVKTMFPRGSKRTNLLRKEMPEDPINRTLNETQYINKKLKEKLAELIGDQKVWATSGAVTDILRERWHLNNIMKELLRNRFENFNTGEKKEKLNLIHWTKEYNSKTEQYQDVEKFEGFSKRLDHRHHAMDAIIIACTKQNHVQYINSLNAINTADQESDESKKVKYAYLKNEVCIGDSSKKFITPWNNDKFINDVKNAINEIIVSHKNTRLLISPSKNKFGQSKVASIRGELHKETNYAKKSYFEGDRTPIKKLIPNIIKLKKENKYQSMVHFKKFDEIIRETVLKEKYQNILIPIFEKYENEKLNDNASCKKISDSILKEIEANKLLIEANTNKALEWLSTYTEKDKSVRPNGLTMDLNSKTAKIDEIKSIADPRIKRIAEYRRNTIITRKTKIDSFDIPKTEKDKLKREVEKLPLYSNAIYEVRVKRNEGQFDWIELKDFNINDIEKIEYAKKETTQLVKNKLREVDFEKLKTSYFDNPVFLSKIPIPIKKVRQKSYFQDLYEITKGKYVYSSDMFMVYFFKNFNDEKQGAKREIKFLKYIDAANIINLEKPDKIDYHKLIEKEKTNSELLNGTQYELLFTLAKNDLVYLPDTNEDVKNIGWNNISSVTNKLFIVKDMNPSLSKIVFQQFYKADAITISEADAKSLFKNLDLKEQIEEIKYGVVEMMQSCIKVFTDKLGKKIVPYWEFPNGSWDKEIAKELGLV
jgi:CRISPR-associated endonuclease Csn1